MSAVEDKEDRSGSPDNNEGQDKDGARPDITATGADEMDMDEARPEATLTFKASSQGLIGIRSLFDT